MSATRKLSVLYMALVIGLILKLSIQQTIALAVRSVVKLASII